MVTENSPVIVTSLYSQMKIFCENILLDTQNPNYKILRLSTLYGYNDYIRKDVFINNILDDIIQGKQIEIFDPFAKRPHLHVLDCARIIGELINCDVEEKILNIGFNELNINKIDLVNIIKKYENFELVENKTEDSRDYSVDFTKLKKYIKSTYILYKDGVINYLNNHKISIN
jgi:nucleoside-diphosphate-sugar epimerase